MFLSIFRSNQPYIGFFIPIINALLWLVVLFRGIDPTSSFNAPLSFLIPYLNFPWTVFITGVLLSSINALLLNHLFNREEFMGKSNHFPALLYSVAASISCTSAEGLFILMGQLVLIPGLFRILSVYREPKALAAYFEAGFWFSLSFLFYSPNLFLIPVAIGCVLFTRPINFREIIMPFLGGLFPIVYLFAWGYLSNNSDLLILWKINPDVQSFDKSQWRLAILFFFTALMILMAMFLYLKSYSRSNNRSRNIKSVFLIISGGLILTSIPLILAETHLIPVIIAPLIAFIGSYLYMENSGASYRDMMFLTWLGLVLLFLWEFF